MGAANAQNGLQNATVYSGLQVPVSQTLPPGQVTNNGLTDQTNVVLTVEVNGTAAGTSAPLARLAAGETAELALSQNVYVAAGQNTVTYKISSTETPAGVDKTFTFTGTDNLFVVDAANTSSSSYANTSSNTSFGNIFDITATVTLSQVIAGFSTTITGRDYSISVYPMAGDLTIAAAPLFTQPATRAGAGFFYIDVPATELTPGRYFLCLTQPTSYSLGLYHDNDRTRSLYRTSAAGSSELVVQAGYGAAALRMVMETGNCAMPASVTVTPGYTSASFTWESNALRYRLNLNDGNSETSHTTSGNSFNVIGLSQGTTYTWSITALCDAVNNATFEGTPFTTKTCGLVTEFPFEETFDNNGSAIPVCWTQEQVTGTTQWSAIAGSTGMPGTAHSGTHKLRFYTLTKGQSARLITPPMDLTGVSTPMLDFWHAQQNWGGDQDSLKIYYRTSTAGEWIHLKTYNTEIADWTKDQIELPEPSADYYIAFVAISGAGRGVMLDDVIIAGSGIPTDGHDLQNLTEYPFTQVPKSQLLPLAQVKNTGFWQQTGIALTADVNGQTVGTSQPLASLEPGESAELALNPPVNVTAGDNTVTYTISQNEPDDTPENNISVIAFTGTQSVLAVDNVIESTAIGTGSSAEQVAMGNIFHINNSVNLSQVVVGHGTATGLTYAIELYEMAAPTTTAATPLFTQNVTRSRTGYSVYTVPKTPLEAGKSYFLCVRQLDLTNISVLCDQKPDNISFFRAADGNLTPIHESFGAVAVRMVMETPDCVAQQPHNLLANPDYTYVNLSWEGTTPLYFLVTVNYNEQNYTYQTRNNSITLNNLPTGTAFTWKVGAMCDAENGSETTGEPFATLTCDAINTFPYSEGFENSGAAFPTCWLTSDWAVVAAETGTPATAHSGSYKVFFSPNSTGAKRLTMPPMDLSDLANPRLSFWHVQQAQGLAQDELRVYSKSSLNGEWTLLATYSNSITAWQKEEIVLPNPSGEYYIAFEGSRTFLYGFGIHLDDVEIIDFNEVIDGEVAQITAPHAGVNYSLLEEEPVTVTVKNNGSDILTGFDLTLALNGDEVATETFTGAIASMGQAEYTFDAKLNLSAEGEYTITVTAVVDGDEATGNNAKTITLQNVICEIVTEFPFTEGFEDATVFPPMCWSGYVTSGAKTWERSTGVHHTGNAAAFHDFQLGVMQEGWLVTPQIAIPETGTYMLEFWTVNPWLNDNEFYHGVLVSTTGNDPATSTFTEVEKLTGGEVSMNWQKISVPLTAYAGQNIYIGFKYRGGNANTWAVDDISIARFTNVDGELTSILTPVTGDGLTQNEAVKVSVKNNGGVALTGFSLKLELNGEEVATEAYTGSAIATAEEAEYTFNAKLDLSAVAVYEVKVTLDIENDEYSDNNTKVKQVATFPADPVTLYGFRMYPGPRGFVTFNSTAPGTVTPVDGYTLPAPATAIWAGEYANGYFYGYTTTESSPLNFVKIDTDTWAEELAVSIATVPEDMAYDHSTGVMYGIVRNAEAIAHLVTIDMETGAVTSKGSMGRKVMTLACTLEGELYAVDVNGDLNTVNKTTGTLTLVGSTGIQVEYVQSMSFDHNTGRLFWAMSNNADEGSLIELDPATGAMFNRGTIAGEAEIIGLYTPYLPEYTISLSANPIAGGNVDGGGENIAHGTEITVTATANEGYEFVNWTEDGEQVSAEAEYEFEVTGNRTLVANFELGETPLPVQLLLAEPNTDNTQVELSWYAPGAAPLDEKTYLLDDGTAETGWTANPNYALQAGNQFVTTDQGTIQSIDTYWTDNASSTGRQVSINLYNADRELVGSSELFTPPAGGWITVPLTSEVPFSGDFYVMINVPAAPGNTDYLGYDENGPNAHSDLDWYYEDGTWVSLHEAAQADPGILIIRANAMVAGETKTYGYGTESSYNKLSRNSEINFQASLMNPAVPVVTGNPTRINRAGSNSKALDGYSVYRLLKGHPESEWTLLETTVNTEYTDSEWETLPSGIYRYAVKVNYTYSTSTATQSADIHREVEIIETPFGLNVEDTDNPADKLFSWNNVPESFTDDVESHEDFIIESIGEYTLIDGDGGTPWGFSGATYPHMLDPQAWIVFNPAGVTPPLANNAHSGSKYFACFAQKTPPNNDWLILPKMSAVSGSVFSFWAQSYSAQYGLERLKVAVSTTGTAPADFTVISEGSHLEVPTAWTEYSFDLSAYAGQEIYVAINCVSNDAFFVMVDDIFMGVPEQDKNGAKSFTGYTVYLDSEENEVAEGITDTQYLFEGLADGTHTAGVKAVYTSGESEIVWSDEFVVENSGIDANSLAAIRLYPNPFTDEITINKPATVKHIQIMNVTGQKVKAIVGGSKISTGELSSGVYFVTVETVTGEKAVYKMVKK
jgi:hypothetical protein